MRTSSSRLIPTVSPRWWPARPGSREDAAAGEHSPGRASSKLADLLHCLAAAVPRLRRGMSALRALVLVGHGAILLGAGMKIGAPALMQRARGVPSARATNLGSYRGSRSQNAGFYPVTTTGAENPGVERRTRRLAPGESPRARDAE